jgi:enolase
MSTLLKTIADARRMGITIMLGASAGESHDAGFLGDLAMGSGIGQVKFGGLSTPDCIERYNQILLTSEEPYGPPFVGETFRR